jgi:hypothetical protein
MVPVSWLLLRSLQRWTRSACSMEIRNAAPYQLTGTRLAASSRPMKLAVVRRLHPFGSDSCIRCTTQH